MKLCKICSNPVYKDGDLCVIHTAQKIWETNTGVDNLGVLVFFRQLVPKAFKNFKYGIPFFHREILWEVLVNKKDWKFFDRQIVIASPRGSSKTTLISKGLALYLAVTQKKRYIVIASKTSRAAEKNLRWIKQSLGNKKLIAFYGDLRPDSRGKNLEVDTIEGKWTSSLIILKNGVTIESVGMGQQLRSAAEGEEANRIDMFIADDCETDENTRTPDRRESNEVWLFETVLPSLDVDTGTIVYINTQTHSESILSKLLSDKSTWRKKFYQISYFDENLNKEVSLWEEKFPLEDIEKIKGNYELVGRINSFYKEYYNEIRSEEGFNERWIKYWAGNVFRQHGVNWIKFKTDYDDKEVILPCYLTLGIDLAFSKKDKADYTVLLPLAQTPDRRKFILPYSRGRFSVYDDYSENGQIIRKGIVDEAIRLHEKYFFNKVIVDAVGAQMGVYESLKKGLYASDIPPMVVPYVATEEKFSRLRDSLQPEYEIGNIHHLRSGMDELKRELVSFGDTTDDILDALDNAKRFSLAPNYIEYHPISIYSDSSEGKQYKPNWMVL